uniref:Uncharacterized protein n=1 Tax=Myoviridae sp. ctxbQ4 TaxID=2827292 RepID=A0A8S5R603_9CAUD|nr:MAG TPA: hypothetical protein [Myoviridae sp. ctxbQ4]
MFEFAVQRIVFAAHGRVYKVSHNYISSLCLCDSNEKPVACGGSSVCVCYGYNTACRCCRHLQTVGVKCYEIAGNERGRRGVAGHFPYLICFYSANCNFSHARRSGACTHCDKCGLCRRSAFCQFSGCKHKRFAFGDGFISRRFIKKRLGYIHPGIFDSYKFKHFFLLLLYGFFVEGSYLRVAFAREKPFPFRKLLFRHCDGIVAGAFRDGAFQMSLGIMHSLPLYRGGNACPDAVGICGGICFFCRESAVAEACEFFEHIRRKLAQVVILLCVGICRVKLRKVGAEYLFVFLLLLQCLCLLLADLVVGLFHVLIRGLAFGFRRDFGKGACRVVLAARPHRFYRTFRQSAERFELFAQSFFFRVGFRFGGRLFFRFFFFGGFRFLRVVGFFFFRLCALRFFAVALFALGFFALGFFVLGFVILALFIFGLAVIFGFFVLFRLFVLGFIVREIIVLVKFRFGDYNLAVFVIFEFIIGARCLFFGSFFFPRRGILFLRCLRLCFIVVVHLFLPPVHLFLLISSFCRRANHRP